MGCRAVAARSRCPQVHPTQLSHTVCVQTSVALSASLSAFLSFLLGLSHRHFFVRHHLPIHHMYTLRHLLGFLLRHFHSPSSKASQGVARKNNSVPCLLRRGSVFWSRSRRPSWRIPHGWRRPRLRRSRGTRRPYRTSSACRPRPRFPVGDAWRGSLPICVRRGVPCQNCSLLSA